MTKVLNESGSCQIPAPSANLACGKWISDSVLGAAVVQGLNATRASGAPLQVVYDGIAEVPAASATTFAKGATVEIDSATDLAVADTAGTFDIGVALVAKTAGQTSVLVKF